MKDAYDRRLWERNNSGAERDVTYSTTPEICLVYCKRIRKRLEMDRLTCTYI